MTSKVFVGNLRFDVSEYEIRNIFSNFKPVHSVSFITDRKTRKPRGFCFVELDDYHIPDVISKLDGVTLKGKKIRINQAFRKRKKSANFTRKSYRYQNKYVNRQAKV